MPHGRIDLGQKQIGDLGWKLAQELDLGDLVGIEGKFGNAKRKGTLQRIMAKLAVTSRTVVTIGLIVLNLDAMLRILRALIQAWHESLVLMRTKLRAQHCTWPLLTWIRLPAEA